MSRCPICDQKPMNCDCTMSERDLFTQVEELTEHIAELEQQNARLTQIISEEPRTKTALPDEFQRLWQACLTLAEKAEFKACFRYLEKLEKQLAERDGLIREYMTESLPYSRRAIEIQQQLEREGGK